MANPELHTQVGIGIVTADTLSAVAANTHIDPVAYARWERMISQGDIDILVAKVGNEYVGRVNVWYAPADEPAIRDHFNGIPLINALQVNESMQGRGIGTKLMIRAHQVAIDKGYLRIGLGVEPDNTRAIALYQKLGYVQQKIGEAETYITSWDETKDDGSVQRYSVPALFMLKEL